jgi:hypothetical protein
MLRLITSELPPLVRGRVQLMQRLTLSIANLTPAEVRSIYAELETLRDTLSVILDKADGKHEI